MRVGAQDVFNAFEEEIELTGDRDMTVEIPIVEVVGRVTMNDEPVLGTIEIHPGSSDRWTASLDENGGFQTWIREPPTNLLMVTVKGEQFSSPTHVTLKDVSVRKGRLELEVELLDLEISGRVVTRRGTPAHDALVLARPKDGMFAKLYTAKDGTFSLRPLQAEEYRLQASRDGYGQSAEELAILDESRPAYETELVLRPSRWQEGFVTGPSGEAVGGARVVTLSVDSDLVSDTVWTDANGRFRAELAADSRRVSVMVAAAGYPLWSACLDSQQPMVLRLASSGGQIEKRVAYEEKPPSPPILRDLLVNELGGIVTTTDIHLWARRTGGGYEKDADGNEVFRVPSVTPGRWALLWETAPLAETVRRACNAGLPQAAEWVTVRPGETVQLVLDFDG